MNLEMTLGKFSMGTGDRFGRQGKAQLKAMIKAKEQGVDITPVWNKSHREHQIVHTHPNDVRQEADAAVKELNWTDDYCVDADHIGLKNVDLFIEASNFFTLDVADFIGEKADDAKVQTFVQKYEKFVGDLEIPGIDESITITKDQIETIAAKFLYAVEEAGRVYRHIAENKKNGGYIIEVSMDETDEPQSPVEMLFILAAISDEGIPAQTIAPKFSGRFNKGVDYVGDVEKFAVEFEQDIAVIAYAVENFNLPKNLKLSVHSGSDKFAIYEPIQKILKKTGAGLHLKTAGTTWLEEIIGLAEAGGTGLDLAKEIYREALGRMDELCGPYATVIDINKDNLPNLQTVEGWDSNAMVSALRHDLSNPAYNLDMRQLLHVGYKVASEMGDRYLNELDTHEPTIEKNVTENVYERHLKRVFI